MDFIYPLAAIVLDFFCVLLCIRLAASKRGQVWIIPMVLSLAFLLGSAVCLLATASDIGGSALSEAASYFSVFILGLSVIWLITIVAFADRTRPNRVIAEDEKAFNEAEYVKHRTERKERKRINVRPAAAARTARVQTLRAKVAKRQPTDLYETGPVSALRLRGTSFRTR